MADIQKVTQELLDQNIIYKRQLIVFNSSKLTDDEWNALKND